MDIYQHLISNCQDIANSGDTPTLALLRARKTVPASTPQLIKALKLWKSNGPIEATISTDNEPKETTEQAKLVALERRVEMLEETVKGLTALLNEGSN